MQTFKPTRSAEPAQWIVDNVKGFADNVLSLVPGGLEAYARVFHPAHQVTHETNKPLRWSEVAKRTGRTAHKLMHWDSIGGATLTTHDYTQFDEDDTWVEAPEEGHLPVEVARSLWQILEHHTETPDKCFFAIWEGFGCIHKSVHEAPAFELPARKFHLFEAPIEAIEETFCTRDRRNAVSSGVLVAIDPSDMASPEEVEAAIEEAMKNFDPLEMFLSQQSANLWWSADRTWCLHTEIDFNTTYIAGSQKAIDAVLANDALEAYQVEPTDEVSAFDTVNL